MRESAVKALSEMKAGQAGTVISFAGDYDSRQRLISLGISVGCNIKLLVCAPGRYMLAINEGRIAIGAQAAEDILVAVEDPEDAVSQAVKRLRQIWAR
jgi:Fe2+ transport system protein FeoA